MKLTQDNSVHTPLEIERFFCCARCLREADQQGVSPETHSRLAVGMTTSGLQVWCIRHSVNVTHVLLGQMEIEPCECCGHEADEEQGQ